jgi:hypothetical protein
MRKLFFVFTAALIFLGGTASCFAQDVSEIISSEYMLRNKNQQAINLYIMKNYNIDRTKKDQVDLMTQTRVKVENLVSDEWTKSFNKEFTQKEKDYLKVLYSSQLMKKLFTFNNTFMNRKEVEDILKANFDPKFKRIKNGK